MARSGGGAGTIGTIAVIGIAGYFLAPKIKQYYLEHIDVKHGAGQMKIKIQGVHLENDGTINMDLQVMNPNSTAFTFKSILGELSAGGKVVADLKMFGAYTVRPNDQTTIPVIAKVQPAIFRALQSATRGQHLAVMFHGSVNVNDSLMPLQLKYQV